MTIDTTPFGHRHKWEMIWGSAEVACFGGDNCAASLPTKEVEKRSNAYPDLLEACEAALSMLSLAIAKAKGEGEPS